MTFLQWRTKSLEEQFATYARVHEWLPSNRPKFKSIYGGTIVRLDDARGAMVKVTKECGAQRTYKKSTFLREFRRLS